MVDTVPSSLGYYEGKKANISVKCSDWHFTFAIIKVSQYYLYVL